jgi:hypothetical protein
MGVMRAPRRPRQGVTEIAFQILDAHGDGRLRRVEPVGRRREAAELGDPVERLELPQVHENRSPRETYPF